MVDLRDKIHHENGGVIMGTAVRSAEELERYAEGHLTDAADWGVNIAEQLAQEEGIKELTAKHWKLITAIRFHYERYGESPGRRDILIETGFTKRDIYELFPISGYRGAYRVARLSEPWKNGDMVMDTPLRSAEEMERDADGYLTNSDDWGVNVAEQLAREEGIKELTARHWKLIAAIRFHYERYGESPGCRDILIETGLTKKDMYELFPPLGHKSAYKVARLPKPIEC